MNIQILKNSKELLDHLKSPNFSLITNIKSFDFSTLYTTIPHQKLKSRHQSNNVIKELVNSNNKNTHTNNDILGEMCTFYEDLYTSKSVDNNDIDSYLQTLHLENVLTQEEKTYCDRFPSIEECTAAVSNLKSNKSPGLDGLTSEFYKAFWSDMKCLFYNALKEIYDNKEMGFSQRLAIMTLIHKKRR